MSWAAAKRYAYGLKEQAHQATQIHFEDLGEGSCRLGTKIYKPTGTGAKFHANDSFVRLIMGPYASGKSTVCCLEIVKRAVEMPCCKDGIRRSKWAIIRNTAGDLETTTLRTWLTWTDELGSVESHKKPVLTYIHRFNDKDGPIELTLLFLGMDLEKDVRKLKSLEITGGYINEACEIHSSVLTHLKGRFPVRFPARTMLADENADYWGGIIMDTNPPDIDHYLYKLFEQTRVPGHLIFKQPPGLVKDADENWITNPQADNIVNLQRKDYYSFMSLGQTQEFIRVYCLGLYGTLMDGKKVFPSYNDDFHATDSIEFDPDHPVYVGWDFGLTPACLLEQFINGQRRSIKEFVTERMGVRELAESIVKPFLESDLEGFTIISVGDPAGGSGKDKLHAMSILNDVGIPSRAAITNNLNSRLDAVNFFMNRLVNGAPAYIVSRSGCPTLRKGYNGKYRYKRMAVIGEEKYRDEPDKSHPYSDVQDCGQYCAMQMRGGISKEQVVKNQRRANADCFSESEWI